MANSKNVTKAASIKIGVAAKKKVARKGLAAANDNVMLSKEMLDKKQASKGLTRRKPVLKKAAKSKSLAKKNTKEVEATELIRDVDLGTAGDAIPELQPA